MTTPRLVVLCIDGGDIGVVDDLQDSGRLPAIAALRGRGSTLHLENKGVFLEEAVWPSALAGQPVGDHALVHFAEFEPATMGLTFRREGELEPWWIHLPDNGTGVLAVDSPEAHPHPGSRADESCCWHAVGPPHAPFFTSESLKRALQRARFALTLNEPSKASTFESERAMSSKLRASLAERARVLAPLIARREVSCVGVHETHALVHWANHHIDPTHWHRSSATDPEIVYGVYEELDRFVAAITDENANVVLFLMRAGRPANWAGHLLDGLLERAGLAVRPSAGVGRAEAGARAGIVESLRRLIPPRAREHIARRVLNMSMQHRLASRAFHDRFDWEQTRAFAVPSWGQGLIRANITGREAEGVLTQEEADRVLDDVIGLLRATKNAETGEPLVTRVDHTLDVITGTNVHRLPDLLVEWGSRAPAFVATHPTLGTWRATEPIPRWTSTSHRPGGVVIAAGPSIRPSKNKTVDPLAFAPTMLALRGVRRPSSMSAEVWDDVLA